MRSYYLDTSVAVHALLGDKRAEAWFDAVTGGTHRVVSSRILRTELTRFLRREGLPVSTRDDVLDHVALIRVSESILTGAEAIAGHVKTLDAIHLASAVATGADAIVVSHDANLLAVAGDLGFESHDPVSADPA